MNLTSSKISLYIHIPFCSNKCNYCDFYSETTGFDRIELVIEEIILQLERRVSDLGNPNIETIFIGGGTPSIIPIAFIDLVVYTYLASSSFSSLFTFGLIKICTFSSVRIGQRAKKWL